MSVLLDTEFEWDDAGGTTTLRKSFQLLLKTLFEEGESFSGKRPLGDSSWEWSLGIGLVDAGLLEGDTDDPDENYFDYSEFLQLIFNAIDEL